MRKKKCYLVVSFSLFFIVAMNAVSFAQYPVTVGAIRWDAWCGNIHPVGLAVERSLGPHKYHYRAPFYSQEISWDSIQCRGATPEIIQKENEYAHFAGINYWAVCWYPRNGGLDTALQLYLQCPHKFGVRWSLIMGTAPFDENTDGPWLVNEFKKDSYQKVLGKRPLLYVYGNLVTRDGLDSLQELNRQAGNDSIYVVVMEESKNKADNLAESLNANAISAYATWAGNNGGPYYPQIPRADSIRWEEHRATGRQVVPWITTGHNTKPRIDHPVWWTKVGATEWTQDATPQQIANHLKQGLDWIDNNRTSTYARTLLIYAWNEFDEGGYICPTLNNNTDRLKAVRKVLVH